MILALISFIFFLSSLNAACDCVFRIMLILLTKFSLSRSEDFRWNGHAYFCLSLHFLIIKNMNAISQTFNLIRETLILCWHRHGPIYAGTKGSFTLSIHIKQAFKNLNLS